MTGRLALRGHISTGANTVREEMACTSLVESRISLARDGAPGVAERLCYGVFPQSVPFNVNVGVFYAHWRGPSFPTSHCLAHVLAKYGMYNRGSVIAVG